MAASSDLKTQLLAQMRQLILLCSCENTHFVLDRFCVIRKVIRDQPGPRFGEVNDHHSTVFLTPLAPNNFLDAVEYRRVISI